MKKKLLFNIHYLEIGGAETSLIGLLHSLNPDEYKVDLMLNDSRGELMKYIPDWVNVINVPKAYAMIERPIIEVLKKGFWKVAFTRLWAKYKFSRYQKIKKPIEGSAIFGFIGKYVTPVLPGLSHLGEYDIAISYLTPHNIVLEKIKAKKKVCWIHTDYSSIDVSREIELPIWSGYDKIISISDKVTETFCSVFPELEYKVEKIEPILSKSFIQKRSEEFIPEDMTRIEDEILFLTIGRYCYQKNLESIPGICKSLLKSGFNVKWFIIGYGRTDEYIRKSIKAQGMEKKVVLLGKKENPYPYIKKCDFYIQPSRYEGNSITVKEAILLNKPIIITNYPTSSSQFNNYDKGYIVSSQINQCISDIIEILSQNYNKK